MRRIAQHPVFPVDVAIGNSKPLSSAASILLSRQNSSSLRDESKRRPSAPAEQETDARTPKPASPAVGTQPHVKSPMHPCPRAPMRRFYAAATGSRLRPIDSAETVLLQTGQCHSSTGGSLPSRWTLWNLARSCLQTCLGATCHLLSADPFTTDEHGWTNYPSCSSCPSAFAESIAASAEDSW